MTIPELSIKQPVLTFMISAVFILFGFIAYQRMGIDRFPTIEFPIISITTTLKGGSPEIIDASVTNVLETAVNAIPGIQHIQSVSSPNISTVSIIFDLKKDVDVAFSEVQTKINQVMNGLPHNIDPPIIAKVGTNASPIMWLALQGDRTLQQLNIYAAQTLKKKLETIDGIGQVLIGGKRERAIRVDLLPDKMAAFGITSQEVSAAFMREHIQFPGGFLVSRNTEVLLNLDLEYHQPEDLEKIIIAYRHSAPIMLKDIASIEDGLEDFRQLARFNGLPTVGLGIIKIPNSNTVAIVDAVKEKLEKQIIPQLPPGMTLSIASNDANYIQAMVDTLREHLIEGTLLAAVVVWIFLRSIRSTIIVALAIPVSLMGAIAVMYFFGYTFNAMTLLALLLLIGVVVDDAIVVLENVFRCREKEDHDPIAATITGSNQVFFAVLAATLSLVSIFAPVIFLGGIVGKFFESFAVVVTCGVLVSLLVSITLTPMLCSRYLKITPTQNRWAIALAHFFERVDLFYSKGLSKALANRGKVLLMTFALLLSSGYFFAATDKEFVPEEDEGRFIISFRTPLGSSIHYTEDRLQLIEKRLGAQPEIASYFTAIGLTQGGAVNEGLAFINLKPNSERKLSQQAIIRNLRNELGEIPGVKAFVGPVPIIGGQRGDPLEFAVVGPNLKGVSKLSESLEHRLMTEPGVGHVDLTLQMNLPQLSLQIDHAKAAALGLSATDLALAVNLLSGGMNIAKFNDLHSEGQRYDIRLKAKDRQFETTRDLSKIFLKSPNGNLVRLDTIASFKESLSAAVISRLDLQYSAHFFSTPTLPLAVAVEKVKETAADILPPGYELRFLGEAEEFSKTAGYMSFAFLLALVLLYMVLASQFNSFIQPLIIMAAQPLAVVGGIFSLWLTGHSVNIYSMIGLVLLIGLVAKNAILLVDLTNQYRRAGKDFMEALLLACPIRLRPILMTSLTVILALLPAALGAGAGGDTNGPLAVAVIGGMIFSTVLTLIVIPVVYSLVESGSAFLNSLTELKTDHFTDSGMHGNNKSI